MVNMSSGHNASIDVFLWILFPTKSQERLLFCLLHVYNLERTNALVLQILYGKGKNKLDTRITLMDYYFLILSSCTHEIHYKEIITYKLSLYKVLFWPFHYKLVTPSAVSIQISVFSHYYVPRTV